MFSLRGQFDIVRREPFTFRESLMRCDGLAVESERDFPSGIPVFHKELKASIAPTMAPLLLPKL
jgi:hypothetical protein